MIFGFEEFASLSFFLSLSFPNGNNKFKIHLDWFECVPLMLMLNAFFLIFGSCFHRGAFVSDDAICLSDFYQRGCLISKSVVRCAQML